VAGITSSSIDASGKSLGSSHESLFAQQFAVQEQFHYRGHLHRQKRAATLRCQSNVGGPSAGSVVISMVAFRSPSADAVSRIVPGSRVLPTMASA